eukprot:CAMPEP_0114591278 /NCGR_PEP_ID=MMETSP0125-20121206/13362_1 /TAXON_ID=485358 ORGANISM="Aristerostoma sp., Strain ATCC 50986" /NCGR_SAMPLE_ID=MMETSP0125 /ASSEMBLY_ACC=CAM_ASM_000245 /LENGTH=261 /DNA_ID=CAMNT_0001789277 /DNA_START=377 /DNA_END=1159 /DNA_ORIENTATION=+
MLTKVISTLQDIKQNGVTKSNLHDMQLFPAKFHRVVRSVPFATKLDKREMMAWNCNDERLYRIKNHIRFRKLATQDQIQKNIDQMIVGLDLGLSMVMSVENMTEGRFKDAIKYATAPFHLWNKNQSRKNIELFVTNPRNVLFESWNILDEPLIGNLLPLVLPGIKTNDVFHINKFYPQLTLNLVEEAIEKKWWDDESKTFFSQDQYKEIPFEKAIHGIWDTKETTGKVPIRIVSPFKHPYDQNHKKILSETLVIHLHGGGW